eukprot:scaffold1034_cov418-Prasinococcus_capsulatus_cf.AAC.23
MAALFRLRRPKPITVPTLQEQHSQVCLKRLQRVRTGMLKGRRWQNRHGASVKPHTPAPMPLFVEKS